MFPFLEVNVRKFIVAASIVLAASGTTGALAQQAAPAAAAPPPSPNTFTANATLVSDYRFRGISQTFKLPAIQGGFDWSHSSGWYAGTWGSNISGNEYPNGASLEWDLYGGWKGEVAKDLTLDLGTLYYYYPGAYAPAFANGNIVPPQNTQKLNNWEIYGALSYKWFSAKLSYSLTDYFGLNNTLITGYSNPAIPAGRALCGIDSSGNVATTNCYTSMPGNSKGTTYLDLNGNWPIAEGWNLLAHFGHTAVKNWTQQSYSDIKLGLTKDLGSGWSFGASLITTNAKAEWYRATTLNANAFAPGINVPGTQVAGAGNPSQSIKSLGNGTTVLSIGRTF